MKKLGLITLAILMLGGGMLSTGCMGSWKLTKSLYNWNDKASGNRYINNVLFWVLGGVQIYSICVIIDAIAFNLVEFWTGSNPMSMKPGEIEQQIVIGKDGNQYQITATQNRFDIFTLSGENKGAKHAVIYIPSDKSVGVEKGGVTSIVARVHEDINKVEVFGVDGSVKMIDMNQLELDRVINGQ